MGIAADHDNMASARQTLAVTDVSISVRPAWVAGTAILVLLAAFVAYVAASFLSDLVN